MAQQCKHDNIEPLTDRVSWCPDCGSQWATTQEEIDRVRVLFERRFTERYPDHPWVKLWQQHE